MKKGLILSVTVLSMLSQTVAYSFGIEEAGEYVDASSSEETIYKPTELKTAPDSTSTGSTNTATESDKNNAETNKTEADKAESGKSEDGKTEIDKTEGDKTNEDGNTSPVLDEKTSLYSFLNDNSMVIRISGTDREKTAIEISKFQNIKSEKVILADAKNFPDALSASSLTIGKYPVLLVRNSMIPELSAEIQRLEAKEAIILGGENSVSKDFENSLRSIPNIKNVVRISGSDRFDTNKKVFEQSGKKKVVLTSGEVYPDALAASPLINGDYGLLLTKKANLPSDIGELIKKNNESPIVIGGTGSVNTEIINSLKSNYGVGSVERIFDDNRYTTSTRIAERFNNETVIITSGDSFPDALASSTLSQKINAPILLVSKDKLRPNVIEYLKNRAIKKCIIIGGESSVGKNTADNIEKVLKGMDVVEESPKPIEKITTKYAVTTSDAKAYYDESLKLLRFTIPANKVVNVLENKGSVVKIKHNDLTGWVSVDKLKNYNAKKFGKVVNTVPYISQLYPVYAPNGCEPTSMLMGLKGKKYTDLGLRQYLDLMPKSKYNPKYGYVGSPYNVESGRFQTIDPEPLAKYGKRYGNVANIQGSPIEDIIKEIQNGNTVVLYATLFWEKPTYRTLQIDGVPTRRIWNNHVVLLTGYDPSTDRFFVADPYNHEKAGASRTKEFFYWKSRAVVEKCYNYDNRKFSVVIR